MLTNRPLSSRPRVGTPSPATPRLRPISSARSSATSAAVRGGGRLFVQSPLSGYTEAEMLCEARLRLQHNKQRIR